MFPVDGRAARFALLCFFSVRLFAAEATLRGRVVDEASAPVSGAVLTFRLSGQSQTPSPPIQTTADQPVNFKSPCRSQAAI